jgi:hypothetical protein
MTHISDKQKYAMLLEQLPLLNKTDQEIIDWIGVLDDPVSQAKMVLICKQLRDMQLAMKYIIRLSINKQ